MVTFNTIEDKEKYVKELKNLNVPDAEIRKQIGKIFNVKYTQSKRLYNRIIRGVKPKSYYKKLVSSVKIDIPVDSVSSNASIGVPSFKFENNNAVAELVDKNVKTLEELLTICNVDISKWKVDKYIVNKWSSMADGEPVPLFQVKAWLVKNEQAQTAEDVAKIFADLLSQAPVKNSFPASPKNKDGLLLSVSVADLHLGKLCWGEETGGENYDSNVADELMRKAVNSLMDLAKGHKIEKILLPIGNDFFNVDGNNNETSGGTPQNEDSRVQKSFMKGCKLLIDIIEYLMTFAPVECHSVFGNHDRERSFYLGAVLEAWFRNTKDVVINNAPSHRKYFKWNKILIGMTHGDGIKRTDLPLVMATEEPEAWAECTTKEWHTGHLHKEQLEDIKGVHIRILPSLCAQDAWHSSKNFIGSRREAIALLYHPVNGLIATYYYRVI